MFLKFNLLISFVSSIILFLLKKKKK